jgi:hypothetical protein
MGSDTTAERSNLSGFNRSAVGSTDSHSCPPGTVETAATFVKQVGASAPPRRGKNSRQAAKPAKKIEPKPLCAVRAFARAFPLLRPFVP